MADSAFNELAYYGEVGSLFPYDLRHDPADRAYLNPRQDGRVELRLRSEHGFSGGVVTFNDGLARVEPLHLLAQDSRFLYWAAAIRPHRTRFRYAFALRTAAGRPVYFAKQGITHVVETPLEADLTERPPLETPDWMHGAIIYQIFPERFANGDPANDPAGTVAWGSAPAGQQFQGGDLPGITANLDYLHDLGVEVLYLNPINTSPSNHKYNASDFFHVDPAFGGDEALHELVAQVHRRGMRIVLDASFNHCDPSFFAFQDLLQHGRDSRYRHWFTVHDHPVRIRYRPDRFPDNHYIPPDRMMDYLEWVSDYTGIPLEKAEDEGPPLEPTYHAWYNVLTMPQFNQRNPETRAYFLNVAAYWLREFDIDGWRMDVVQHVVDDFWPEFRRVCRAVRPDCYLLAEVWGDTSRWLQNGFDATMNYIFRDLCLDYFARTTLNTAGFVDGLTRMQAMYAPQVTAVNQNLLSSHDVPRFLHVAGERPERWRLATLFQLTMPGSPSIYYGDEIGMTGGRDPDNRRAFPWEERASWDEETLALVRSLTRLRREQPAVRLGDWRPVWQAEEALAYVRQHDQERVLVVINRGEGALTVELPLPSDGPQRLWGTAGVGQGAAGVQISDLAPWSGVVVRL